MEETKINPCRLCEAPKEYRAEFCFKPCRDKADYDRWQVVCDESQREWKEQERLRDHHNVADPDAYSADEPDIPLGGIPSTTVFFSPLSDREMRVLTLLLAGLSRKDISEQLGITPNNLRVIMFNIRKKAK